MTELTIIVPKGTNSETVARFEQGLGEEFEGLEIWVNGPYHDVDDVHIEVDGEWSDDPEIERRVVGVFDRASKWREEYSITVYTHPFQIGYTSDRDQGEPFDDFLARLEEALEERGYTARALWAETDETDVVIEPDDGLRDVIEAEVDGAWAAADIVPPSEDDEDDEDLDDEDPDNY